MPVWKLQTAIGVNSTMVRDNMVITPHFNDQGVGSDPQQLCEDWADAVAAQTGNQRQVIVKAYDEEGAQPVFPAGEAVRNIGMAPAALSPSEVALCLSFYSTRNLPRYRGRLYIPICAQFAGLASRPASTHMTHVSEYAIAAQELGGPDVDWCVYSRSDGVARPVTNWYVDDEWDTVRSRGQRSTTRLEGTTSEA